MNSARDAVLLRAEAVHRSFRVARHPDLHVLKGVDLTIRRGEILAVVGPSGAGKSTFLHILGTLDRPTSGKVLIEGADAFAFSGAELAAFRNRKVGFVFQFHHLLPDFTALENVALPGLIARRDSRGVFDAARRLLDTMGLSDRLSHKPSELSGGEQQRVAFARALINDPAVVLADEPSGNLDHANSTAMHDLMWTMARDRNKAMVVVTHNPELAGRADRVIELFDGMIKK